MYQSPISLYEKAVEAIIEQREDRIFAKIQDAFDVQVDKEELIRALQYDRDQYAKGRMDAIMEMDLVKVVRCKDCGHRGDPVMCPMCYEEYQEWDDDGYHEWETVVHDYSVDSGFCYMGERGDNEHISI